MMRTGMLTIRWIIRASAFETPEFEEDATDEEKAKDLEDRQKQAEDVLAQIENGDTVDGFELTEGAKYSAVPSSAAAWLFVCKSRG